MEGNDELWEAAVLRGAVAPVEGAHGAAPWLPVPTAAQADLHRRREEAQNQRVQTADEESKARDAQSVVGAAQARVQ